jgi:hypothetical protein
MNIPVISNAKIRTSIAFGSLVVGVLLAVLGGVGGGGGFKSG